MSKEKKQNKLVPELRFPEFEGEWENEPLGEVYSFKITNSFSRSKLNYDKGKVKNIHYGDIHTKFSTLFDITKEYVPFINEDVSIERISEENYCQEGDIVIADASEDLDDIGKSIEIVNLNNGKLLAGLHTFLARQIEPKLIIGFGGYLFKSDGIRNQIKREAQGAKVLGISKGRISDLKLYYPNEKKEQQKIAQTLTSLDHLIAAENEKLDALQAHKKGLLQQLFPAKGERVPKVRFGEFEGAWVKTTLVQVANYENGKAHEKEIEDTGKYIVVNSKFISSDGEVIKLSDSINCETSIGDILMVLSDIPNGKAIAKCFYVDKDDTYTVNQRICRITPTGIENRFLYYILNRNSYFLSFDDGVKQTNLRKDTVLNCPLLKPAAPKEQQKIAACLSSLDDLIAAQSEKIAALKEHKKGLMQGLFPSMV